MTSIGKKEEKDYVQIAIKKYIADRKTDLSTVPEREGGEQEHEASPN